MRYIKSYNNTTDLRTDLDAGKLDHPYVAKINETIDFDSIGTNWKKEYFTIIALTDGTISYSHKEGSNPMFYSINEGEWIETTASVDIPVSKNNMIRFKSNRGNQAYNQETFTSGGTAQFEVAGNLMSLVAGDDFATYVPNTNATGTDGELYCSFKNFFGYCTGLASAKNLIIKYCDNESFNQFFNGCHNLQIPPKLPATTLANSCYENMFQGCTSLTKAPELPATTLANNCYSNMFNGCWTLLTAPELPATTLANSCYENMFQGCTNLASAPTLPAMTLANNCYQGMFQDCTLLTTAPALPAMALANNCYNNMFQGCTSLTAAPALPATTLAQGCYYQMFMGCTSLKTSPVLPANTLANRCYYGMFYDTNVLPDCSNIDFASSTVVASGGLIGLFAGTKVTDNDLERLLPKNDNGKYYLPVTTLASDCYSSMFQNCTSLTTAPELPATTLTFFCYSSMFAGCTSLTTAPALPATTLETMCYSSMFNGCTSLTTAPELPATTLNFMCYDGIFQSCTSLNYIKCLATDISAPSCTGSWVSGVASTGTFVKAASMNDWTTGANGIPTGWTVQDV